jgi:hypothetical protein
LLKSLLWKIQNNLIYLKSYLMKNIIKFLIIFSFIFGITNSKVSAQSPDSLGKLIDILGQTSNKINGEKLEKLLTENYILVNGRSGSYQYSAEWRFNKNKTYTVIDKNDSGYKHPFKGKWELVGFGNSFLRLEDISNTRFQVSFGEDGNIYAGSEKIYSYRLENIQEKIDKETRITEEKRIAEELRLKKLEEEKKQLAIKREQERIKQEEEKKKFQTEYELALKKDKERREEEERKEMYENITKYSLLVSFFVIICVFTYKNKSKINYFYSKFINLIKESKKSIINKEELKSNYKKIKNSSNSSSNFFKSILNKESSLEEKYIYLLPALLSIFYIINNQFIHPILKNVIFTYWSNLGSGFVFIINSVFIIYKNYKISKKLNFISFLLFLIFCFWTYSWFIGWDSGPTLFWIILIIQLYLFLNLYLQTEFNIQIINKISNLFVFNYLKNISNKNKSIIVGIIFFGMFIFYFVNSNNTISFSKKNELETCSDTYNWLNKKINSLRSAKPGSREYSNMYQYQSYQRIAADYYRIAQNRITSLNAVGQKHTIDTNMVNLCEKLKINLD